MEETKAIVVTMSEMDNVVKFGEVCRLCVNQNEKTLSIYSEEGMLNDLANKINLYLPIKISESDTLPLQCCWNCASTVLAWHELVISSVEADRRLREIQLAAEKSSPEVIDIVTENADTTEDTDGLEIDKKIIKGEIEETGITLTNDLDMSDGDTDEAGNEKNFRCPICPAKFATKVCLSIHTFQLHSFNYDQYMTTKKTQKNKSLDCKYYCDFCKAGFIRKTDLHNHLNQKHPKAPKILEEEESDSEADSDIEEELKFECTSCNAVYPRKSLLNEHLRSVHNIHKKIRKTRRKRADVVANYFCDVCSRGYTRKFDMVRHRKSQHPNAASKNTDSKKAHLEDRDLLNRCRVESSDDKDYYVCDICDKTFRAAYYLTRHYTIHTGIRPFSCHICGKSFRISSGLTRHIKEFHQRLKKFKCRICDKTFAAKQTRDDHENIHSNNRPFVCDICGKSFRQKASLHVHKLFHTNNFRFECKFCDKKFRRANELKVHSWIHTGHKPHCCEICGSLFRLKQDLTRHRKIHDKLNTYICIDCGANFSQERYLRVHMKIHENKTQELTEEASQTIDVN